MATLELKLGDLFDAQADAIGHGVNTHGTMASGIAVLFKRNYQEMHGRYVDLCEIFGDDLAGSTYLYFKDEIGNGSFPYIANIFSQKLPGANAEVKLLIDGIKDAFAALWGENEINAPHLAIPLIGCGIGGLDWDSDVHPALVNLVASLPDDWRLTVISNEPRDGFVA